jgi:hypothetical protein
MDGWMEPVEEGGKKRKMRRWKEEKGEKKGEKGKGKGKKERETKEKGRYSQYTSLTNTPRKLD